MKNERKARLRGHSFDHLGLFDFIQVEKNTWHQYMDSRSAVTVIVYILTSNKPIGVNTGWLLSPASLFTNTNRVTLIKAVAQVIRQLGQHAAVPHDCRRDFAWWASSERWVQDPLSPCGHFLLAQFVWRRSVISQSIRQLENDNEGLTWSINSPIRGPNSKSGKWSIRPAEWQTWLIRCG